MAQIPNNPYAMPVSIGQTSSQFMSNQLNSVPTITYVTDEQGVKSYPVAPGATVFLFNMNAGKFWIKTGGPNGMYYDLKEYTFELVPGFDDGSPYATKDQIAALNEKIDKLINEIGGIDK